jgi:hypothetical protein
MLELKGNLLTAMAALGFNLKPMEKSGVLLQILMAFHESV